MDNGIDRPYFAPRCSREQLQRCPIAQLAERLTLDQEVPLDALDDLSGWVEDIALQQTRTQEGMDRILLESREQFEYTKEQLEHILARLPAGTLLMGPEKGEDSILAVTEFESLLERGIGAS